jgi:hypothetical protein
MARSNTLYAAGFASKIDGVLEYKKAFLCTEKNACHVDDMMEILRSFFKGVNVAIPLSQVGDIDHLRYQFAAYPHPGALKFIDAAMDSGEPLDDWVIYIMTSERVYNPNEAALIRKTKEPPGS